MVLVTGCSITTNVTDVLSLQLHGEMLERHVINIQQILSPLQIQTSNLFWKVQV